MHQQLIKLVQGTAMGKTLLSVSEEDCEEMFQRYLHDFVRIVHKCSHKGQEIVSKEYKVRLRYISLTHDRTDCAPSPPLSLLQLISDAIHKMIVHASDFNTIDGHMTLTDRIAAVHIVYSSICKELHWFDQLTFQYPGIVYILLEEVPQMSPGDKGIVSA